MGELMVKREAIFYGVRIRAVLDSGPGHPLFVSIAAADAEWFAPEDAGAQAGYVRDFDPGTVTGELELCFTDERVHRSAVAQLAAWQENPPPQLTGVSSLRDQYVGLIDRDTSIGVGVKLSAEAQDRP